MKSGSTGRNVVIAFWVAAVVALAVWSQVPGYAVGWDLQIYVNAIHSLRLGHDPYVDAIAVQRIYHALPAAQRSPVPPYSYVYSPITLPLLGVIARLPMMLSGMLYWLIYLAGALSAILVVGQLAEPAERRIFRYLAPAAIFFPGMLQNDAVFSGNIAYILYGIIFAMALLGWRRNIWWPFYMAVLLASCVKAPLLYLLAIPILSARRQWMPACLTGIAGLGLFAVQPLIWPVKFHNYLEAVDLQFLFNRDFSSSPSGLLTNALYEHVSYRAFSVSFWIFYALPFFALMVFLSRQYFAGKLTQREWLPVMLVGVMLLNPRIMEYDIAPFTLVDAIISWRVAVIAGRGSLLRSVAWASGFFMLINLLAPEYLPGHPHWKPVACMTMLTLFFAGVWMLLRRLKAQAVVVAT